MLVERVEAETAGWLRTDGAALPIDVSLGYDPADPFAVVLALGEPCEDVWVLGRDLLAAGLRSLAPLGEGVYTVRATSVLIEIAAHAGGPTPVALRLPWWTTREFLRRTLAVVPAGAETCDVDAWVAALVAPQEP